MKKILILSMFLVLAASLFAAEPVIYINDSGVGRVIYSGTVSSVYVSNYGMLLFCYDTPMTAETLTKGQQNFNAELIQTRAAAFQISENPVFGEYLYKTLLSALEGGNKVRVVMKDVYNGYPLIDRIWIYE